MSTDLTSMKHLFHHVCRTFSVVDDRSCCKKSGVPVILSPRCIAGDAPGMLAAWRVLESSAWVESIADGIEATCAFSKVHKRHTLSTMKKSPVCFFRGIILVSSTHRIHKFCQTYEYIPGLLYLFSALSAVPLRVIGM